MKYNVSPSTCKKDFCKTKAKCTVVANSILGAVLGLEVKGVPEWPQTQCCVWKCNQQTAVEKNLKSCIVAPRLDFNIWLA